MPASLCRAGGIETEYLLAKALRAIAGSHVGGQQNISSVLFLGMENGVPMTERLFLLALAASPRQVSGVSPFVSDSEKLDKAQMAESVEALARELRFPNGGGLSRDTMRKAKRMSSSSPAAAAHLELILSQMRKMVTR